jgi:hypothetical protein
MMKEMMSAVFTPIIELANKAKESEKLKLKTVEALPQKRQNTYRFFKLFRKPMNLHLSPKQL